MNVNGTKFLITEVPISIYQFHRTTLKNPEAIVLRTPCMRSIQLLLICNCMKITVIPLTTAVNRCMRVKHLSYRLMANLNFPLSSAILPSLSDTFRSSIARALSSSFCFSSEGSRAFSAAGGLFFFWFDFDF